MRDVLPDDLWPVRHVLDTADWLEALPIVNQPDPHATAVENALMARLIGHQGSPPYTETAPAHPGSLGHLQRNLLAAQLERRANDGSLAFYGLRDALQQGDFTAARAQALINAGAAHQDIAVLMHDAAVPHLTRAFPAAGIALTGGSVDPSRDLAGEILLHALLTLQPLPPGMARASLYSSALMPSCCEGYDLAREVMAGSRSIASRTLTERAANLHDALRGVASSAAQLRFKLAECLTDAAGMRAQVTALAVQETVALNRDLLTLRLDVDDNTLPQCLSRLETLLVSPLTWALAETGAQATDWAPDAPDIIAKGSIAHEVLEHLFPAGPICAAEAIAPGVEQHFEPAIRNHAAFMLAASWKLERESLCRDILRAAGAWRDLLVAEGAEILATDRSEGDGLDAIPQGVTPGMAYHQLRDSGLLHHGITARDGSRMEGIVTDIGDRAIALLQTRIAEVGEGTIRLNAAGDEEFFRKTAKLIPLCAVRQPDDRRLPHPGRTMTPFTVVPAGAGAGRTHPIKEQLTDWVRAGDVRPDRILAVTFTEDAAGELRERIRASLLDAGMIDAALAVDRAYVSTIHGLGLRVLTEHAFAGGRRPRRAICQMPNATC